MPSLGAKAVRSGLSYWALRERFKPHGIVIEELPGSAGYKVRYMEDKTRPLLASEGGKYNQKRKLPKWEVETLDQAEAQARRLMQLKPKATTKETE